MLGRTALVLLVAAARLLLAQAEYRVYNDHPRLFLDEDHLRRIQRTAERETPRWLRLKQKLAASEQLAEPALARALVYQASGAEQDGRLAVEWALGEARTGRFAQPGKLRWGAIVFDWCYPLLSADERTSLASALAGAVEQNMQLSGREIGRIREGVLAAIALAGDWEGSEPALKNFLDTQWAEDIVPLLEDGQRADFGEDLIALTETALAVRENLERDLWQEVPGVFQSLPMARILSYLPETIETPEGLARRPAFAPDSDVAPEAVLGRIAEMLMVAYEPAARELQFLQGWLRNDSFTLKGPLGALYEFLWINPYLPGLSPASGPQIAYDAHRGRLFAHVSEPGGYAWFAYLDGRLLTDRGGKIVPAPADVSEMEVPGATAAVVGASGKFEVEVQPSTPANPPRIYLVGLEAGRSYNVRVNRNDWRLYSAAAGGVVVIRNQLDDKGFRINFKKPIKIQIRPSLEAPPGRGRPTLKR